MLRGIKIETHESCFCIDSGRYVVVPMENSIQASQCCGYAKLCETTHLALAPSRLLRLAWLPQAQILVLPKDARLKEATDDYASRAHCIKVY